ncbi:LPXTG cell wall anchor domain-containing protein [Sphingomonas sp.]|uniref:LPXTG cell wall anchor domain-containing protein n=1 Tax=Sphingomonas sp. TaxID=28214 RepID=UPI0025CFA5F5|nr:LPXTG cell wall anchor domain-containing protein [Sphingomonas sp.]
MLRRAGMLLAGLAVLPGMAAAQSTGSTPPQSIPDLGGFNLPPKPKPTPTPPPSGPIVAPFSRPTPIPTFAPTPAPAPSKTVTPPPVTATRPSSTTPAATPTPRPTPRTGTPAPQATPTPAPTTTTPPATSAAPAPIATATPEPVPSAAPTAAAPAPAEQPSSGWSSGTLVAIGVALLALLAGGWFLFGRRRREEDLYEEEVVAPVVAPVAPPRPAPRAAAPAPAPAPVPEPAPAPAPAAPSGLLTVPLRRIAEGLQPAPQPPAPPLPAGLVTVRAPQAPVRSLEDLKPELEIVLIPQRAGTDPSMSAAIEYRIVIRNTGRGDARDVRFGIYMTTASARQAADLQTIFANPVEQPVLAPFEIHAGSQVELSGTAMLPRANLNVMTIDGKPWFVPVLAMKAEYRWGENVGAPGVATAAHMIGINRGEGAKLAPFRLDGEPRMHPKVAERRVA